MNDLNAPKKIKEIGNTVIVKYANGSIKRFIASELAVSYLRLDKAAFYNSYGFNYIPSPEIQELAREKISHC